LAIDVIAVLSVGLSILLMVLTNTEHAPAAGTALGLVVGGWAPSAILFVLLGAVILSAVHMLLRPHLTNLL
jgi:CBS-domain-containing membrane protein